MAAQRSRPSPCIKRDAQHNAFRSILVPPHIQNQTSCRALPLNPPCMLDVQIQTLFRDLTEEIRSGQYINSLGNPQASVAFVVPPATPASAMATDGPLISMPHNFSSASNPSHSSSLPSHRVSPPPLTPANAYTGLVSPPGSGGSRSRAARPPLPPRLAAPPPGHPSSGSGTAAAVYSPVGVSALGHRGRAGGLPLALARPHRDAVRAVLSMPCDTIPEDDRADFAPLPPFSWSVATASPAPATADAAVPRPQHAARGSPPAAAVVGQESALLPAAHTPPCRPYDRLGS